MSLVSGSLWKLWPLPNSPHPTCKTKIVLHIEFNALVSPQKSECISPEWILGQQHNLINTHNIVETDTLKDQAIYNEKWKKTLQDRNGHKFFLFNDFVEYYPSKSRLFLVVSVKLKKDDFKNFYIKTGRLKCWLICCMNNESHKIFSSIACWLALKLNMRFRISQAKLQQYVGI